jgi:signal transduction histidine kinase
MKGEADKLDFLVTDFLEYSRLQAGKLRLNVSATSLDMILAELIAAYQTRSLQEKIGLEFRSEEMLPIIEADARRLDRVFRNLLDNAFKFSEEGGTVGVAASASEREVIVKISDQGCGIDAEHLPYVFDAFFRGGRGSGMKGFGLGLATVKAIVEAHGGRVHVESSIGEGSTFTVVLPKSVA